MNKESSKESLISAYEAIFQDDFERAHKTLEGQNNCPESLLLRAALFFEEGDMGKAFSFSIQSVYLNPQNKRAWALLRDALCHLSPPLSDVTHALIVDLLSQDGLDHEKLSPYLSELLSPLAALSIKELENYPLFIDVLSKMLLIGLEWEKAKNRLRFALLDEEALTEVSLPLLAGLSSQYYFSDYLPEVDPSLYLNDKLSSPTNLKELLLKSCFTKLSLSDFINLSEDDSPYYKELKERTFSGTYKPLFDLENQESVLRDFYEKNPYPRWETLDLFKAPFSKHIELSLELKKPIAPLKNCLIAGCGTGAHLLKLAAEYPDTEFTGIDLSRCSLEFAKSKMKKFQTSHPHLFENVEFIRADLCDKNALAKKFDWIECVGVIHHLSSPKEGWRALYNLSNDYGLLFGGVYHSHARQLIAQFKPLKNEGLQELRERIASDERGLPIVQSMDFYSLHACRDLLLHPQEKSYTLKELLKELEETGWRFLKLKLNHPWKALYLKQYPQDPQCKRVENLLAFEEKAPSAFNGMILFWAEKAL